MPITKNGSGEIVETPSLDFDQFKRTGVHRADEFAICDRFDRLKQMKFDTSAQLPNTTLTLAAGAITADSVFTFPTSGGIISTAAFKTIQTPSGTSPVATGPTDTLTFTSSDGTIDITGNSGTDTIDLGVAAAVQNGNISGEIFPVEDRVYTIELACTEARTLNTLAIQLGSGTCVAAIAIDGVAVTGLSALSVTTGFQSFTATAANSAAINDTITLTITGQVGASELMFTLKYTRS